MPADVPARGASTAATAASDEVAAAKTALRRSIAARRSALTETDRTASAAALADAFGLWLPEAELVAVYLSVGSEPGTAALIEALRLRSVPMIAPVLRPDADLDWAAVSDQQPVPGLRGTLEPTGALLGVEAIANADVVLVPALAVDESGRRLGRGGGSYDRALVRMRSGSRALAVVHDDEVIDRVPAAAHDFRVDGVVTPRGVRIFDSH